MQRIPESGGLAFGPPEGPWIDCVPLGRLTGTLSVLPVRLALRDRAALWEPWETSPAARLSPVRRRGMVGVTGTLADPTLAPGAAGVAVIFRYPPALSPVQALRRIAQAEGGRLPADLGAAVLAAALALRRGRDGPQTRAPQMLLSPLTLARLAVRETTTARDLGEQAVLPALARGEPLPLPADPVDRALLLLRAARALWEPATLLHPPEPTAPERLADLAFLAAVDLELHPRTELVLPSGVVVRLRGETAALVAVWPILAEWARGNLGPAAFRFLWGEERPLPPERPPQDLVTPSLRVPAAMAAALRQAFVETAGTGARYAPLGPMLVRVPAGLLGTAPDRARFRLWVDGQGLWVAVDVIGPGAARLRLPPCRWEPDRVFRPFLTPAETAAGLDLILAALWHDLRVGGPAAFPAVREGEAKTGETVHRTVSPARPENGAAPDRGVRTGAVRTLPSSVRLGGGERAWGTGAERLQARRAHLVRGHIRQLPVGRRPHPEARARAATYGLVLPAGYTFVRPHVRGRGAGENGGDVTPAPPEIRARGLVTLLALGGPENGAGRQTASVL